MVIKSNLPIVWYITRSMGLIRELNCRRLGRVQKIAIFLSFWLTMLNLLLIVITNAAIIIKNPGPCVEDFTVLYQNAWGFVPFSALGKEILPLDNNLLVDFQSYVFENKPWKDGFPKSTWIMKSIQIIHIDVIGWIGLLKPILWILIIKINLEPVVVESHACTAIRLIS